MRSNPRWQLAVTLAIAATVCLERGVHADSRLKDIATLQGTGAMPLIGQGLVVGLNKTGDKRQSLAAVHVR